VYGIAFPEKDLLKDYQYRMEEARKRDHRNVGTQQQLFMFDRLSPGSAFFLPAGTIVYNNLVNVSQQSGGLLTIWLECWHHRLQHAGQVRCCRRHPRRGIC
jgi:hypothetical protein